MIFRFLLLVILFVFLAVFFYSLIPFIVWIFGGSFLAVAQHPMYAALGGTTDFVLTGALLASCVDDDYYLKP